MGAFEKEAPLEIISEVECTSDFLHLTFSLKPKAFQSQNKEFSMEGFNTLGHQERNLWERTCFEAFFKKEDGSYIEWNFSPSGEWNAYFFKDYRTPFPPQELEKAEELVIKGEGHRDSLRISLQKSKFETFQLSAIIHHQGIFHYALSHPLKEKPDFHHPAGFIDWQERN